MFGIRILVFASAIASLAMAVEPVRAAMKVGTKAGLEASDDIIVVIGNRKYRKGIPEVRFAHRDIAAIRRFSLDVMGARDGNIIELSDATQAEMLAVFGSHRRPEGKLAAYVKPNRSRVLVYYSGHGIQGLNDRERYLLPIDTDPDMVEINGYPVDLLLDNLSRLPAVSVTVMVDACFSGESAAGYLRKNASGISISPKILDVPSKITFISATRANQLASWDMKAEHGLFTEHLLEGLYGDADKHPFGNGDGVVTLAELRLLLDDRMTYAARRNHNRQQQAGIIGDEGFVLASLTGGAPKRPRISFPEKRSAVPRPPKVAPKRIKVSIVQVTSAKREDSSMQSYLKKAFDDLKIVAWGGETRLNVIAKVENVFSEGGDASAAEAANVLRNILQDGGRTFVADSKGGPTKASAYVSLRGTLKPSGRMIDATGHGEASKASGGAESVVRSIAVKRALRNAAKNMKRLVEKMR